MVERRVARHPALVDEDGVVLQRELHPAAAWRAPAGGKGEREREQAQAAARERGIYACISAIRVRRLNPARAVKVSRACSPSMPPYRRRRSALRPGGRRAAGARRCPPAGRRSRCAPPRSTTTTCGRCAASGCRADRLPMILGCDAAGVDADGNEVVVHSVVTRTTTGAATRRSTRGARSCPSGTRARSPSGWRCRGATSSPKPPELSFAEAACLPTAWLTAYRMLFTRAAVCPARRCWCRARAAAWRRR